MNLVIEQELKNTQQRQSAINSFNPLPNHELRGGKSYGKTISARILTEAKAQFSHTDWDIAKIAHSLGF